MAPRRGLHPFFAQWRRCAGQLEPEGWMTSRPAWRPENEGAAGAGPLGTENDGRQSVRVKVVNPVWNGSGYIERKTANFYVAEGRAVFVGDDQLRLIASHPKNKAASWRAATGYERIQRTMTRAELRHLPVVRPEILLTDRSTRARRGFAGRSGPVRVLQEVER